MANHISIRLAWHNDGWNGHVCKNPKENIYCCGRYSYPGDIIARDKDLEWESKPEVCGKSCSKLDKIPPCSCSINAFGQETARTFQKPPVWFNDSSEGKYIDLPPATVCTWAYDAMYGDDVERKNEKGQKYDNNKRFENVKEYFSETEEGKTLLFYYANYSNPFSQEDANQYVLVGVSRLKKKGEFHFYNNASERIKKNYANGLIWQYPITSNYPEEGFRLPFHRYKDNPEIFDKLAIFPDNTNVFKYATRVLSDDDALSVIEQFISVVKYLKSINDNTENWDERLKWLYNVTSELWKTRGPYPGLMKILNFLNFKEGIEYLKNEHDNQITVLDNIKELLNGKINKINGMDIDNKTMSILSREWQLKDDEEKELLLSILPRFDLSEVQIKNIMHDKRKDNGLYASLKEICQNPYILSEQYSGDDNSDFISFNKIDNGILPSPATGLSYFLEINSRERFRALCINTLKRISEHSFLSDNVILNDINGLMENYPDSKKCEFKVKYFEVDKLFLSESLFIKEKENKKFVYLKDIWEDERIIEAAIIDMLQRGDISLKTPITTKFFEKSLYKSDSKIAQLSEEKYRNAIEKQSEVCFSIFNKPLCVISGAAGTGKTTIVKSLIEGIERTNGQGTSFLLLAPTGKAAQRIREESKRDSSTIHSFIASEGWLNDNFTFKRQGGKKEKDYQTIIIDECSMIDLSLMAALFRCIEWNSVERLILIGDPNQLPPIGRGKVFSDIIEYLSDENNNYKNNLGKLEINLRLLESQVNEEGVGILSLAEIYIQENQKNNSQFKFKKEQVLKKVQEGGIIDKDLSVYFWKNDEDFEKIIKKVIHEDLAKEMNKPQDYAIHDLWQSFCRKDNKYLDPRVMQILSPSRSEYYGVDFLNSFFQEVFNEKELSKYSLDGITLGDKVIQIRNRSGRFKIAVYNHNSGKQEKETIYNGEIGFSFKHPFDKFIYRLEKFNVIFESRPALNYNYGNLIGYFNEPVEGNLELAYVLSIHKAQGSEFERVYLILPKNDKRLLSMELLYTGITRARKHLTIFAQEDISCFTKLSTIEKSNLKRINSSIFNFYPLPDEIIFPTVESWYSDSKKISTLSEYYVRSKSEMNIANILSLKEIPFEYEKLLFAPDGTMYLPDFTITYKGRTFYWEHLGRLDLPEYKKHWEEKEAWYNKHFKDQLIITYESDNQTKDIENIINEVIFNKAI